MRLNHARTLLRVPHFDIGDVVGVSGPLFRTRTGEATIRVESVEMLAKSLRPLPFGNGRAYRVLTWLPRVAVLSSGAEDGLQAGAGARRQGLRPGQHRRVGWSHALIPPQTPRGGRR